MVQLLDCGSLDIMWYYVSIVVVWVKYGIVVRIVVVWVKYGIAVIVVV